MSQVKILKRGEILFKEGDKLNYIYVIQSGGISQCLIKNKKPVDLFQLGANQILNEGAIYGTNTANFTAMASSELKYMEIPVEIFKQQVEAANPVIKTLVKSLVERLRMSLNDIKTSRMEKDGSPCPEDQVAKVFGSIYHVASHKGEKEKDGRTGIFWTMMKQYAQRIFAESPKRLEHALGILLKLKLVEFEYGPDIDDPEGPEVLHRIYLKDLPVIENFFEFYQYHYFKGSKGDILKYDEFCYKFTNLFIHMSEGMQADRFGMMTLEYNEVMKAFKKEFGLDLKPDHFARLEMKGIYTKRVSSEKSGVTLQFEYKEFKNILYCWRILNEIDKWNTKGFVDITEDLDKKDIEKTGLQCFSCNAPFVENQKFCTDCGMKLAA